MFQKFVKINGKYIKKKHIVSLKVSDRCERKGCNFHLQITLSNGAVETVECDTEKEVKKILRKVK
jgi:hypothetical protein